MFLKYVKNIFTRIPSITMRLTLFYTATTFILLILTTVALYLVMANILYQSEYQLLSDEIDILQHAIEKKPYEPFTIQQKINELFKKVNQLPQILDSSVYDYYIRILFDKNLLVTETTGMKKYLQGTDFFSQPIKIGEKKIAHWRSPHGTNYLLMQSLIMTNVPSQHTWTIQIALDVTYQHTIMKGYRNKLMIGLFSGTLLALILGYLIAQRSMRRLHDLTETTKNITSISLHHRINPESWPKELSELGMAFNQMLDRIENSFSRLTQLSDDLAHELRSPINNLIGETEVALFRFSSAEEYRQVLESNLEEAHRISQMIENLLFLARAENPHLNMKKSVIDIEKEINLVCDFYQALIDEKSIKTFCTGKASVAAHPDMFRRMLSNILSNALKYTPEGGEIHFDIQELDSSVRLVIKDNGIGIAKEHVPNIFNRFYRVDSARSHLSGGTGLGLAIVKSIIELHHGTITVTSIPALGTKFLIILPK